MEASSVNQIGPSDLKQLIPASKAAGNYYMFTNHLEKYGNFFDPDEDKTYQFFINQNPLDPFRQQIRKEVEACTSRIGTKLDNLDGPKIAIPDANALENQATHYFEKYGIAIRMANNGTLSEILKELNEKIASPVYLGIIASARDINESSTISAHITPLLFYFPGNHQKNEIQCISLDSVGKTFSLVHIKNFGISQENTYFLSTIRQADPYSCHLDAVVVLRNALLSLRYHECVNGFKEALQAADLKGNEIISLPPEWDYTSQIRNVRLTDQYAIRSVFSKKCKLQLAIDHRKKHTEMSRFRGSIYSTKDQAAITALPPEGVTYNSERPFAWSVRFEFNKKVNTYLLNKGLKLAKKTGADKLENEPV